MANVTININGADFTADVEPRLLLTHFIRENANLTGTHTGCDTSGCGACTIWLDGIPIKSCTMFAVQANGKKLTTIEGLAQSGVLDPMQDAFKEMHGLQCGFCTPGMILTSVAFLKKNPDPTEDEVRWAISGNLCRCTGYNNIVAAVQYAAGKIHDAEVTMAGAHSAEGGN